MRAGHQRAAARHHAQVRVEVADRRHPGPAELPVELRQRALPAQGRGRVEDLDVGVDAVRAGLVGPLDDHLTAVGEQHLARVPATVLHARLLRPGLAERVERVDRVQPLDATGARELAAGDEELAVGQEGLPRAVDVVRRVDPLQIAVHGIPDHAPARARAEAVGRRPPQDDLAGRERGGVDRVHREVERRAPGARQRPRIVRRGGRRERLAVHEAAGLAAERTAVQRAAESRVARRRRPLLGVLLRVRRSEHLGLERAQLSLRKPGRGSRGVTSDGRP